MENPKVENDCAELKKSRKFPMSAIPSVPIKIAMAFDVKKPATILIKMATEFKDAIFIRTLDLILFMKLFKNVLSYTNAKGIIFILAALHLVKLQTANYQTVKEPHHKTKDSLQNDP